MKVVILAGGYGSRLSEEIETKPKPFVNIGEYPVRWHFMKQYAHRGFNDFPIALGYKDDTIKKYFVDYLSFSRYPKIPFLSGQTNPSKDSSCC